MSTSSAAAFRGLCGTLIAATTLTTGLRLYSRRVQKAHLGADDYTIIPAWFLFLGMNIAVLLGVQKLQIGADYQTKLASGVPAVFTRELYLAMDVSATLSEGFTRISALLFYKRIFCVSQRSMWLLRTVQVGIVVLVLWMIAFICLPLLQCGPDITVISTASKVDVQTICGKGASNYVNGYGISNVIIEAIIIILPIPLVVRLHTTLKRRLGVLLVFLTAFLSLAAGFARLAITVLVGSTHLAPEAADVRNAQLSFFWIFSAGMALIAINLPSLVWIGKKAKPEQILSSIRSAISLRSLSQKSQQSSHHIDEQGQYTKAESRNTSSTPSTKPETAIHQTYSITVENDSLSEVEAQNTKSSNGNSH